MTAVLRTHEPGFCPNVCYLQPPLIHSSPCLCRQQAAVMAPGNTGPSISSAACLLLFLLIRDGHHMGTGGSGKQLVYSVYTVSFLQKWKMA